MSIPNLVTLVRILLVPIVVWAITSGEMRIAFLLFLVAGVSDAIDGFVAKHLLGVDNDHADGIDVR